MPDILNNLPPPPLTPQHIYSFAEDTDGSEADTVLDTPTSLTDLSQSSTPNPRWTLASAFSTAFSRHSSPHKLKRHSELPGGGGRPLSSYLSSASSSSRRLSLFPAQNNRTSLDSGCNTKLELPPSPSLSLQQEQEQEPTSIALPLLDQPNHQTTAIPDAPLGHHELTRVARLLTVVYRFEASRHDHPPSILDFVSLLKAHLEDWIDHPTAAARTAATKRAIKHVGRRPNLADDTVSKVQRRRWRRRQLHHVRLHINKKRKKQNLHQEPQETGDDQERALMDSIHAAQMPLLAEVTELQRTLDGLRDEKDDVEQTLDEVQHELELVLEELDYEKQQNIEYRSIITRLESHLHQVELHDEPDDDDDDAALHTAPPSLPPKNTNESALMAVRYNEVLTRAKELEAESSHLRHSVERLKLEREQARTQMERRLQRHTDELQRVKKALTHAEKRVAEGELKLEVAKSTAKRQKEALEQQLAKAAVQQEQQQQQHNVLAAVGIELQAQHQACRKVEMALSREVARREAQVAQLERTLQQLTDQQHRSRSDWERRTHDELSAVYMQEKEVYKVQISRELRTLASQLADQETEIESLERRYSEAAIAAMRADSVRKEAQEKCNIRMSQYEKDEKDLRSTILKLEQKISSLENDSLQLYSRNIKLASQLGQWAP